MAIRMSKRTGKMYGSEEEYLNTEIEPAFKRIRRYEEVNLKTQTFKDIRNQSELSEWIRNITGNDNKGLSRMIPETDEYKKMIEENREEKKVLKEYPVSFDKKNAKARGLIFVGRDRRGRIYAYDYEKKKRIKADKYRL